jgi:hypothetical protein
MLFRKALLLTTLSLTTLIHGRQMQVAPQGASAESTSAASGLNVRTLGAKGDNRSDDTQAIQKAMHMAFGRGGLPGNVYLPRGHYRINEQLGMYNTEESKPTDGGCLIGDGIQQTILIWQGPPNQSAVRMIGAFQCVRDLTIVAESDWLSGISYDGDPHIGRSTHGTIERVHINCNGHNGDGIDLGKNSFQADMLTIYHPYIQRCTQGNGIATWNGNVLSITVLGPTFGRNHVGILKGTTTNLSVFSGEFDWQDINFVASGGGPLNITGVRSENSKRSYFDGVGGAAQPVTFMNYFLSNINVERPQSKATIAAQSRDLTLSVGGYVEGDWINIPGAGPGGKALRAKITEWSGPTHVKIQPPAATSVNGVLVSLDGAQYNFEENSLGPYIHIGMLVLGPGSEVVPNSRGAQVFIGDVFGENIPNPFGLPSAAAMPPHSFIVSSFGNANRPQPMANWEGR